MVFKNPLYREGRPLLQALDAALPVADQQDEHEWDLSWVERSKNGGIQAAGACPHRKWHPSVVDIKPGPGLEAGFEIEQRGLYERAGQKLGEASVT